MFNPFIKIQLVPSTKVLEEKAEEEEVESTELLVPLGTPMVAEVASSEYIALAKACGLADSPIGLKAEFECMIKEENFNLYNEEKVRAYLNNLCRKEAIRTKGVVEWKWYPLRTSDLVPYIDGTWIFHDTPRTYSVPIANKLYSHYIPMPVLETIKKIVDRFADRLILLVSDYTSSDPDPFLKVGIAKTSNWWVIERWDEPGFRS